MNLTGRTKISAIIMAAGLSTRMGALKQLLPYGQHTVVEQVVSVLLTRSLAEVVVVTGHERQAIEAKLARWPVRSVFNPHYQTGEMLVSIQSGLKALDPAIAATLIVLGDQPQLEADTVQQLITAYQNGRGRLIIPSYQMRRGHPILIDQTFWPDILALPSTKTLRSFINAHTDEIHYVTVDTDTVMRDLDTPEEYQRELRLLAEKKPRSNSPT